MANNSYTVNYAPTGRSTCKFTHCKEKIGQGEIRIAKCFPSDRFTDGGSGNDFYHPKCWFEQQKKAKKTTKKIESEDDMDGFDSLKSKDQDMIRELLRHKDDPPLFKKAAKKKDGGPSTPKKAAKQVYVDSDEEKYVNNDSDADNKPSKSNTTKTTKSPVKPKPTNNNNNNKHNNSDGEESEDLEKDAWGTVAANGSRVAKILNSTAITQVSVLILGSASRKAIKRVALENDEDRSFDTAFGFGSSSSGSSSSGSADPDAWLQWLAGLGVLWISSDSSDAGFSSSGLWFDTLSMIVKQVFMTKPKKGIVVVLWGSEVKHFKKEAQAHYKATMGTVHYRVVEGPTPLNDIFNPRDMVKKIDSARSELGLSPVHWWPHEGEISHSNNNNSNNNNNNNNNGNVNNSAKKKGKQSSLIEDGNMNWKLESADVEQSVELSEEPTELGRALVSNKKISRKQCVVKAVPNGIELTPLGVNPMTMSRRGNDDVEILSRNDTYTLGEGDSFTLCGEQYRFVLKRSDKDSEEKKKTPTKKKEPTSDNENDNDKTRIGDDEEDQQMEDEIAPEKVKKSTKPSSTETESATVPFSAAGYDDESSKEEEKKEVKKEKKEKKDIKMNDDEDDEAANDAEIARKMQEEFDKETKKKSPSNTPKSKHSTPDKDEILARKLQNKFNKEGGDSGGSSKKRKQEDDDDEEVNWAAKVKKPKKGKKGNDDDDDDWMGGGGASDNDDDDDEEYNDEDEKPKNKKGGGGGGGGGSAKKKKKQPCMYGAKCYRTNPQHLEEFSHPK